MVSAPATRYRTPGAYFEWLDPPKPGIVPMRTDVAGFVGIAARGPLHTPLQIESWPQFVSAFGAHTAQGYLAYAVEGFFANGGVLCHVVRVADPDRALPARLTLVSREGQPLLELTAASPGAWAQRMAVAAIPGPQNRFTLVLRTDDGVREIWPNLSPGADDVRDAVGVLNDPDAGSRLVEASEPGAAGGAKRLTVGAAPKGMGGGADGLATLRLAHIVGPGNPPLRPWGLAALEAIDLVSIVAIPDLMIEAPSVSAPRPRPLDCERIETAPDAAALLARPVVDEPTPPAERAPPLSPDDIAAAQRALIAHCETLHDRVALLDTAAIDVTASSAVTRRDLFDTSFAALYYPWLLVADPLRIDGPLRAVPPSGHLAGILARGDRRQNVAKPPANEAIELAQDVRDRLADFAHGELNDHHVNAIRTYPGRGIRVMGARTLSRELTWRFLNVRRLLIAIEEAIDEQTQDIVFEPNNRALWRDLERAVRGFLTDLWRRGMLEGATADDAFEVTCDETTNPPEETDAGRVVCRVGIQPPLPAEFVIVRLGKSERGTEIIAAEGVGRG